MIIPYKVINRILTTGSLFAYYLCAICNTTYNSQVSEEVVNRVAVMLEECSGLDYIEKLQEHENERIYNKSAQVCRFYNH